MKQLLGHLACRWGIFQGFVALGPVCTNDNCDAWDRGRLLRALSPCLVYLGKGYSNERRPRKSVLLFSFYYLCEQGTRATAERGTSKAASEFLPSFICALRLRLRSSSLPQALLSTTILPPLITSKPHLVFLAQVQLKQILEHVKIDKEL